MIVPMRVIILCLFGNVLVGAIQSPRTDEGSTGMLRADGLPELKLHDQKPSSIALEDEPLWVPWWVPQITPHFTFFRAVMAGLFGIFIFATAMYLTGHSVPFKLGPKCVFKAMSLWKKAPPAPEPAAPTLPAIPETPNVDNLDGELLQRACFAEAIAKKQVETFFKAAAKRKKKQPVPQKEDLMSSDDEDVEDPDPPLRPGAEAPFTLLFGADCAEGARPQEHVPFALLMADYPRPAVDTIRAPMVVSDLKTVISTKKFRHSCDRKAQLVGDNVGLSSSSSS